MPNDAPTRPVRLRVVLSLAAGLLAEIFTIVVVAIVLFGHRLIASAETPEQTQAFMMRAGSIVGPLFGVIFTFVMALWVVRKAKGRYMAHGVLVGVGAAAIHVITTIGAPGGYGMIHAIADILKLCAGAAAAMIATRREAERVPA
jgi:ethanolamine transporter EutH